MESTSISLHMSLHLMRPPTDTTSKFPWFPLCLIVNIATTRATLNYIIVDKLAQYPPSMSALEVFQTCPLQHKDLLSVLGVIDPFDSMLITFDLDQGEPQMPSSITFQDLVTIQNLVIH